MDENFGRFAFTATSNRCFSHVASSNPRTCAPSSRAIQEVLAARMRAAESVSPNRSAFPCMKACSDEVNRFPSCSKIAAPHWLRHDRVGGAETFPESGKNTNSKPDGSRSNASLRCSMSIGESR